MSRIVFSVIASVLAFMGSAAIPGDVAAWHHDCSLSGSATSEGWISDTHSGVLGGRAKIEDTTSTEPDLCIFPIGTPSSSWSGVRIGDSSSIYDKFEIGVVYCWFDCPSGVGGDSGAFYYRSYGRKASTPCGAAVVPTKVVTPKAHVTGSLWYQIVKVSPYYYARVGGADQYWISWEIDLCWPSATYATYFSGHRNAFDQYHGRVGDQQLFSSLTWQDSGGQHSVSRTLSALCDVTGSNGNSCKVSPTSHDAFNTWDTRQP